LNRDDKSAIVSELNDSFNRAKFTVVTDYCGLTVSELQELRIQLRDFDSEIRIAKNTLLKRAVSDTVNDSLIDDFIFGIMSNWMYGILSGLIAIAPNVLREKNFDSQTITLN